MVPHLFGFFLDSLQLVSVWCRPSFTWAGRLSQLRSPASCSSRPCGHSGAPAPGCSPCYLWTLHPLNTTSSLSGADLHLPFGNKPLTGKMEGGSVPSPVVAGLLLAPPWAVKTQYYFLGSGRGLDSQHSSPSRQSLTEPPAEDPPLCLGDITSLCDCRAV